MEARVDCRECRGEGESRKQWDECWGRRRRGMVGEGVGGRDRREKRLREIEEREGRERGNEGK